VTVTIVVIVVIAVAAVIVRAVTSIDRSSAEAGTSPDSSAEQLKRKRRFFLLGREWRLSFSEGVFCQE
jgi:CHASE1-domain containing sensor protein